MGAVQGAVPVRPPCSFRDASDRKHPDRDDGAERYQAADRPADGVSGLILARIAHRVGSQHCRSPVHGLAPTGLPGKTILQNRTRSAPAETKTTIG